ncbi:hypothetical protein SASPL_145351 [Salvia splendens]|uniref:DNA topoisomerase n=1 Tax=Salvia splendens TaxID=180675 RepID=A0A8X8WHG2_SALSN|nr:hypothetical protein SASPL_145351 [Salvia splendens]
MEGKSRLQQICRINRDLILKIDSVWMNRDLKDECLILGSILEKPSVAKQVAGILSKNPSSGGMRTRDGQSRYNRIFEFNCVVRSQLIQMSFTSVTGHLMELEFDDRYRKWHHCDPVDLYHAPVKKYVPQAKLRASVFEAIEEEDKVIEKEDGLPPALLGSCNDRAKQLHNSPSGDGYNWINWTSRKHWRKKLGSVSGLSCGLIAVEGNKSRAHGCKADVYECLDEKMGCSRKYLDLSCRTVGS